MNKLSNYTVCIIKPDAFPRVSEERLRPADSLDVVAASLFGAAQCVRTELIKFTRPMVDVFYREHVGKPFYEAHAEFMTSGASYALLLKYDHAQPAFHTLRWMLGATDPTKADPSTLRAHYGTQLPRNGFHGSDSVEAVLREALFFWSGATLVSVGFPLEEGTEEVVRG